MVLAHTGELNVVLTLNTASNGFVELRRAVRRPLEREKHGTHRRDCEPIRSLAKDQSSRYLTTSRECPATDEIADERAALTSELTALFGPIIQHLVEAEILSVDVPEGVSFAGAVASVNYIHVDDEHGIIVDCVPRATENAMS